MAISLERERDLMRTALEYCGTLVREVVGTYTAFEELPPEEQAFIDEYIVRIGDGLTRQAGKRAARSKAGGR